MLKQKSSLKVCYILSYKSPRYIRTETILAAFAHIKNVELSTAINQTSGWRRYLQTFNQFYTIHRHTQPDCYVIGFRGHEIFLLLRWFLRKKWVIFDSMMSPTAALLEENKLGKIGQILGYFSYWVEKSNLHRANIILTDTDNHAAFLADYFKLPKNKIKTLSVGAKENIEPSAISISSDRLSVLFYGSFLPLHGVSVLLEAATRLQDQPIDWVLIGGKPKDIEPFLSLPQVTHIPWVDFDSLLSDYVAKADIGLGGPFGGTAQANRVVTGKTLQFLALSKPTLIGKIPNMIGFIDKQNCLLIEQNDPDALVDALQWALVHKAQLPAIGQAGQQLYNQQFSIHQVAEKLKTVLQCREDNF